MKFNWTSGGMYNMLLVTTQGLIISYFVLCLLESQHTGGADGFGRGVFEKRWQGSIAWTSLMHLRSIPSIIWDVNRLTPFLLPCQAYHARSSGTSALLLPSVMIPEPPFKKNRQTFRNGDHSVWWTAIRILAQRVKLSFRAWIEWGQMSAEYKDRN